MKRILCAVGLWSICATSLCAQMVKSPDREFSRHWYLQLQGGVGYTVGEADFCKLLSPAAALSAGYRFTPVWGLRAGISGWKGHGAWLSPVKVYGFNFVQVNADVTVDLANWIGGYKYDRLVNPYVFLGLGADFAFDNRQAQAVNDEGYRLGLLWSGCRFFVAGRAGAGVDFRLSDRISVGLEMNTNLLPDRFNSKKAGNADWQVNALAGVTFRFNKSGKKTSFPVPPVAIPAPAVEEPAVADTPVTPAAETIAETSAIQTGNDAVPAVPAAADGSAAPEPPSPDTYKMRQDIFFAINSFDLRPSEEMKIAALVQMLKANPQAKVSVVGYADAPTGNSKSNYWLSGWRAIGVRNALKKRGIGSSRIKLDFKGDKEQPYTDVGDNRVVICIVR